jgi:hypothetical protein
MARYHPLVNGPTAKLKERTFARLVSLGSVPHATVAAVCSLYDPIDLDFGEEIGMRRSGLQHHELLEVLVGVDEGEEV